MSKRDFWILAPCVVGVILYGALFYTMAKQEGRVIRYDCRMAEISPDFPPDVKNECRKLNSGRL